MKKLILAIIVSLAFTAGALAQDVPQGTTPQKPKTIEELTWQSQALQNEFLYLQERLKNIQGEFKKVQEELATAKKAQKPPAPAPEMLKETPNKGAGKSK